MPIQFPHANNYKVDDALFMATWQTWFERFGPEDRNWRTAPMPRLHAKRVLAEQLAREYQFSLDVLCRFVVPWSYRNTMQATNVFMEANAHLLKPLQCTNRITGHRVNCARILESARKDWDDIAFEKRQELLAEAEALIEADVEVGNSEPRLLPAATENQTETTLSS